MNRLLRFFISVLLPICIAALAAFLFKSVYETAEGAYAAWNGETALPFGIHRMCVWLVPTKFDLAGTVGIIFLNVLVGGIIGGFALVYQICKGSIQTIVGS